MRSMSELHRYFVRPQKYPLMLRDSILLPSNACSMASLLPKHVLQKERTVDGHQGASSTRHAVAAAARKTPQELPVMKTQCLIPANLLTKGWNLDELGVIFDLAGGVAI